MKRHTQKQLLHLFAGLFIVIIAFYLFERDHIIQGTILFGSGCIFLILAGAHTWIEKNIRRISSVFFFLEAITFYYAANHYESTGHKQYFNWLIAAAILFFLLGIIYMATKKTKSGKYKSRSSRSRGPKEF